MITLVLVIVLLLMILVMVMSPAVTVSVEVVCGLVDDVLDTVLRVSNSKNNELSVNK